MAIKFESGRPELLKYINQELVIRHVVRSQEISRADLARETGLSLPSIMRIVDALVEKGYLIEIGIGTSSAGRKPSLLAINKAHKYVVGIEIAGRSMVTLADFGGNPIEAITIDSKDSQSPEAILDLLLSATNQLIANHNLNPSDIAGIGIGTPGNNFKHNKPMKGFILKGWESIDVGAWFSQRLQIPVIVENVCRTRTISEIWFGDGRLHPDFLYVYLDQGVGVGIVSKGMILEGAHGVAGEFGHMSIDMKGKQCYCGKKGCIEMYVSLGAQAQRLQEGTAPGALLEAVSDELAFALANMVNLLNPPIIILGGLVVKSMPGLTEMVKQKMMPYVFHNLALKTQVIESQLDNESACLGSIALVIHQTLMART